MPNGILDCAKFPIPIHETNEARSVRIAISCTESLWKRFEREKEKEKEREEGIQRVSSFLHAKVRTRSRMLPPTPTLSTATHVSPIRRDKGTRETAELKNRETMREDTCRFLRGQMAPVVNYSRWDEASDREAFSIKTGRLGREPGREQCNRGGVDKSWRGFSRVRVNGRERIIGRGRERGRRDANYRTSRGGHRR